MTPSIPPKDEANCNNTLENDASRTENVAALANDIVAEELELGRHEERKQYKLPISNITRDRPHGGMLDVWREAVSSFHYNTGKVPHRSLLLQHRGNYLTKISKRENNIHLLLPEWLHEKLLCKTCCGFRFGNDESVRYVGDLIIMFFETIVQPACGIWVVVSTLTTDASIPEWIHYAGGAFYILFVPFLWVGFVRKVLEDSTINTILEIDSEKLKWYLIITFVVTFICSPIYGIWALATLPADATIDTNFGLKLGGYAFCISSIPWWFLCCIPLAGVTRVKGWQVIALCIAFLLTSAIHQGVVGELIWFPYLAVPGLLACVPILVTVLIPLLVALVLLAVESRVDWLPQLPVMVTDSAFFLLYVVAVNVMAGLVADRNLLQPTHVLLEDDLLYAGAVCFYVVSVVVVCFTALGLVLLDDDV